MWEIIKKLLLPNLLYQKNCSKTLHIKYIKATLSWGSDLNLIKEINKTVTMQHQGCEPDRKIAIYVLFLFCYVLCLCVVLLEIKTLKILT